MTDSSEFSPEQASDPGTSMQDMARIAAERPDLWASLAANPSLYPDLREWLSQIDDPAVKEALSTSVQQAAEQAPAEAEPVEAAGEAPAAEAEEASESTVAGTSAGDDPAEAEEVPAAEQADEAEASPAEEVPAAEQADEAEASPAEGAPAEDEPSVEAEASPTEDAPVDDVVSAEEASELTVAETSVGDEPAEAAEEEAPAEDELSVEAEASPTEEVPAAEQAAEAEVEPVEAEEAPAAEAEASSAEEVPAAEQAAEAEAEPVEAEEVPAAGDEAEKTSEPAVADVPTAVMGTPPPPPSAPTAAMGTPPPPPPARASGKRRRKKWVPIAAVLAAVLAVGGGAFAVYTYLTQRGAASPDEVMSTVSQAIVDKDIISMFKMVSPSEIDTVADSADAIRDGGSDSRKGSSKADPGALLSKDAINNYLEALDVSSSEMTYSVDQKSDDLAIATISSWHLDVSVDQSLADTLRTRYQSAKGSSLTDDEEEFFSNLDFSDLSYDGDFAEDFSEDFNNEGIPLEIVMIKEDGRWYISPLLTSAQWSYQTQTKWDDDVESPNYDADFDSVKGADSPEAAVQNLTEAILDARRPSDMLDDSVTGLLSLPERRLAMVYGPVMIGDDAKFSERASENVKIDWDLTSTDIGGGQSVVQPGNSTITLNPDDDDEKITFEFEGNTMKVTTPASDNNTASVDFTRQLEDPDRLGVVVEKSDGTWHVSSSGTIVNIFSLRPSERALDKFSDTLEDLGVDSDDSDELADTITQSVAIATPILVGVDIAEQLQDVEWRDSYSYDSYDTYSGSSTDSYYDQCTSGDMVACDRLYVMSSSGSFDESYGRSCGGRDYSLNYGGACESKYGRWY